MDQDWEILILRESLSRFNGDVDHVNKCLSQATWDHDASRRALEGEKLRLNETLKIVDSHSLAVWEWEAALGNIFKEADHLRHSFAVVRDDEAALEAEIRAASH